MMIILNISNVKYNTRYIKSNDVCDMMIKDNTL